VGGKGVADIDVGFLQHASRWPGLNTFRSYAFAYSKL
jgi:hypothetical protein